MTTMFTKITLAWIAMMGHAIADNPRNAKAPARPAKADPMAKPVASPPTEIDVMAKSIVGIWKCSGTETGMDGSARPITGKITAKLDLEKWWINDVFEGKGARGNFKLVAYSTFDAGSKKWRRVSVDSMGHQYVGTSDGMKEGKLTWNMDFLGMMGSGSFRDTIDTSAPKAGVKFAGTMSMDKGKSWKPVYEMTCKK